MARIKIPGLEGGGIGAGVSTGAAPGGMPGASPMAAMAPPAVGAPKSGGGHGGTGFVNLQQILDANKQGAAKMNSDLNQRSTDLNSAYKSSLADLQAQQAATVAGGPTPDITPTLDAATAASGWNKQMTTTAGKAQGLNTVYGNHGAYNSGMAGLDALLLGQKPQGMGMGGTGFYDPLSGFLNSKTYRYQAPAAVGTGPAYAPQQEWDVNPYVDTPAKEKSGAKNDKEGDGWAKNGY